MKLREIIIGTRGSKLALCQAEDIKTRIENLGEKVTCSLKIIKTKGDKILDVALSKIGDKGLFVKEIETALMNKEIDLAVHSMKDLPSFIPEELTIGAVPKRKDQRDVLVSKNNIKISDLPPDSIIGTSSLRRRAQTLAFRKDFIIEDIRGNLDTRLKKLETGNYDAIVLAAAGLIRMNWAEKITEYIEPEIMLPAVGQGAIAVEARKNDPELLTILKKIDDPYTHNCVIGERSFLKTLEGGCQVPIGAMAVIEGDLFILEGVIASLDGLKVYRDTLEGPKEKAEELGVTLAQKLLKDGAGEILKEIRHE